MFALISAHNTVSEVLQQVQNRFSTRGHARHSTGQLVPVARLRWGVSSWPRRDSFFRQTREGWPIDSWVWSLPPTGGRRS